MEFHSSRDRKIREYRGRLRTAQSKIREKIAVAELAHELAHELNNPQWLAVVRITLTRSLADLDRADSDSVGLAQSTIDRACLGYAHFGAPY